MQVESGNSQIVITLFLFKADAALVVSVFCCYGLLFFLKQQKMGTELPKSHLVSLFVILSFILLELHYHSGTCIKSEQHKPWKKIILYIFNEGMKPFFLVFVHFIGYNNLYIKWHHVFNLIYAIS